MIKDFGEEIKSRVAAGKKKVLLSAATFSVGAYYYGDYIEAKPKGSKSSGMWV